MLALIMAGGEGTRLGLGEKPLVMVQGRPMIRSVMDTFRGAGYEIVVVLTPRTPYTANWCRVQGVTSLMTCGMGYIPDLVEAVRELEEQGPLFTSVSDLPCLQVSTVQHIRELYERAALPACSAWVPVRLLQQRGISHSYEESVEGEAAVPAGINILMGNRIEEEQEESRFLIPSPDLALHVNTRSDLALARKFCPEVQKDAQFSKKQYSEPEN